MSLHKALLEIDLFITNVRLGCDLINNVFLSLDELYCCTSGIGTCVTERFLFFKNVGSISVPYRSIMPLLATIMKLLWWKLFFFQGHVHAHITLVIFSQTDYMSVTLFQIHDEGAVF